MTTPEHTLVGIHFAFACGIHRICGWRGVVLAAFASNVPDWDGLPMLFDMQRFESGHRVWGHGILSVAVTSMLLGFIQIRWDWLGQVARWSRSWNGPTSTVELPPVPIDLGRLTGSVAFVSIAFVSQLLHLPCDMVVSGGNGLSDWAVQPWWPFSSASYVYPLIPWGDIGPTVILMAGLFAVAKNRLHVSLFASLTLISLVVYLFVRGWTRGLAS